VGGVEGLQNGTVEEGQRDPALKVLEAVAKVPHLEHVTLVSSSHPLDAFETVHRGRMEAAREASLLKHPQVRVATILRPGVMYSDERPLSMLAGAGAKLLKRVVMGGTGPLSSWVSYVQEEPLQVETVATACVQSVLADNLQAHGTSPSREPQGNPSEVLKVGEPGSNQPKWPEFAQVLGAEDIQSLSESFPRQYRYSCHPPPKEDFAI
jgi:hypothetical protein